MRKRQLMKYNRSQFAKPQYPHLTSIRQMCLQIHVHIHIRILNRTNRLNVIQPKTLGHLTKVWSWHHTQKPRHNLLDWPSLLLGQFVNHGSLCHTLDVNVVCSLPWTKVRWRASGLGRVGSFGVVTVWFVDAREGTCVCLLEKTSGRSILTGASAR